MDCIFCKIVSKQIPCKIIYEDERVIAFNDLEPQSPVHILIIPKEHILSVNSLNATNKSIVGHIFLIAKDIAEKQQLKNGYRIVNNCGIEGGQSVNHLHFHLLGGRSMKWPPG